MRLQQIPDLNLSQFEDFYLEYFDNYENAFKNTSNEKDLQTGIYVELLSPFLTNNQAQKQFTLLDIGCGKGTLTVKLLNKLKKVFPEVTFNVTGVDPHEVLLEHFSNNLVKLENVILSQPIKSKISELKDSIKEQKYDILLFDHSLYCLESSANFYNILKNTQGVCLISLASNYSPTSFYRKYYLNNELQYSEDIIQTLSEKNYDYSKIRYHSNFEIEYSKAIDVVSWIKMKKVENFNDAADCLNTIAEYDVTKKKYLLKNVADIILIHSKPNTNIDIWTRNLSRIFNEQAKKNGDESLTNFLFNPKEDFHKILSFSLGFKESGSLLVGYNEIIKKEDIKESNTYPLIFSPTCRTHTNFSDDLYYELESKVKFLNSAEFFKTKKYKHSSPSLENLLSINGLFIEQLWQNSDISQLADELDGFFERLDKAEQKLGAIWIKGGEHVFYSLLAALKTPESEDRLINIIKYTGLSIPGGINNNSFIPSKKAIKLIEWLKAISAEEDKSLSTSLKNLKAEFKKHNISINELEIVEGKIDINIFSELLNSLKEKTFSTRAVPEICLFISFGMWAEIPNLLIFPLPKHAKKRAYGFITCADLDENLDGLLHENDDIFYSKPVIRNILHLISIFKQLLLADIVKKYETAFSEEDLSKFLEELKETLDNSSRSENLELKVRKLPYLAFKKMLEDCTPSKDNNRYQKIVTLIFRFLFSDNFYIKEQYRIGTKPYIPDIVCDFKTDNNIEGVKRLREKFGDTIIIEVKNINETRKVTSEDLKQLKSYMEQLNSRLGFLVYRGEQLNLSSFPKGVGDIINEVHEKNNGWIFIINDKRLLQLLDTWTLGADKLYEKLLLFL